MSNILSINNSNVTQFGFSALFKPFEKQILFDLSGNTIILVPANTTGVNFMVTDPNGIVLGAIDFPTIDINTATGGTTFTLSGLQSGTAFYGVYKIKGVLKEGANLHTIEYEVNVCQNEDLEVSTNIIPSSLGLEVDCINAQVLVKDNQVKRYMLNPPTSETKSLAIKDADGVSVTTTALPYFYNFDGKKSGLFSFDGLIKSTFNITDLNNIEFRYVSKVQKEINCSNRICDLTCCISDVQDIIEEGGANAASYKEKLDTAQGKINMAFLNYICGKNIDAIVDEIREELNCDCKCSEVSNIMSKNPMILGEGASALTLEGTCGITVSIVGGVATISTPTYSVSTTDEAVTITKVITTCGVEYRVVLNKTKLVQDILTTIQGNPTYTQTLAGIVNNYNATNNVGGSGSVNIVGIDWGSLQKPICNYSLQGNLENKYFSGVVIDGVTYSMPTATQIISANITAIDNYLDGLGKGVFSVSLSGGILLITSNANQYQPQKIEYKDSIVSGIKTLDFSSPCFSIDTILNHFISQVCPCTPCVPLNFVVTEIGETSFKVTAIGLGASESYKISTNNGGSYTTTTDNPYIVLGATSNTEYKVSLKRLCEGREVLSPYQTIITKPTIAACAIPQVQISVVNSTTMQVNILNYVAGETYVITYGVATMAVTSPSTTISGLSAATTYATYVTHQCGATSSSSPTQNIQTINTACQIAISSITNITSNSITVNYGTLAGATAYTIEIYSSAGVLLATNTGGASPRVINGLNPSTAYKIKVVPLGGSCAGEFQNNETPVTTAAAVVSYGFSANLGETITGSAPYLQGADNYCIMGNGLTKTVYCNTATPAIASVIYDDEALTIPILGRSYVRFATQLGGNIYTMNSGTGAIVAFHANCV